MDNYNGLALAGHIGQLKLRSYSYRPVFVIRITYLYLCRIWPLQLDSAKTFSCIYLYLYHNVIFRFLRHPDFQII